MKLKALALAAVMSAGVLPGMVLAGELPNGPHVVTSGQASVEARPDIATLSIVVNVSSKDAADAKKQADSRVAQYFDFLQKNGIEKKDIDAANLSTQPEYDYTKEGKSVLKGYRAVRQVQVTLRQLEKLNELLDGALKSGLNEIRAVDLGVAHPETYKDQARKAAIANATQQAAALAEGFNAKLGPVYSIRYHVANYQPMPMARMFKASAAEADTSAQQTYEQQSIHFDDQVDVVFDIKPNAQ
nr:oxidative stress defense protein [Pantoea cypripedii]